MSLVGIKNLFFRKTVTPVIGRRKTSIGMFYHSFGTSVPQGCQYLEKLLLTHGSLGSENSQSDETIVTELESQNSTILKANEKGFRVDARVISDATIGLSDGLTVPFALTAGLSALGNTKVVIYGGFAELIAGAISMGLGGYLGAKSEL